ncbi:alpha/beta hydrolase [Actinocrispum wychmicini]|uniref:Alpha/beta hydrolase family protein n=1 Tax=Actinocrispum wychmicini TaxID=1213861 RepID=A0A4R2J664_9PSEU|nr:alpha/beta hydrolase [Actinocrispum wychmicini]TCO52972.1 alpha/beta hydrolase family protein [Actinocrispum wychmicini]
MRNPLRHRRRGVALCAALGLIAAPAAAAAPAVPVLDWQPCDSGFFCATATVPLDQAHPAGATIRLAVIKHPATDPAHRIGSVFFNPGGPGGPGFPGVTLLPPLYAHFPPDLRARFDLVSFDPRGIGQSTALQCFDTIDQEQQLIARRPPGFPVGAAQERTWENIAAALDAACAAHAGPLLAHDTTADVARDMDLLRQAVGDPTMNYIGLSYGSYLGATYANLFPDKVRAITLDGAIDPVAWATGTDGSARRLGTFLRLGSDEAAAAALDTFLDLCGRATTSSCAFSAGSSAATHAKYTALLDRLDRHPVTLAGTTVNGPVGVGLTISGLFYTQRIPNVTTGWPGLATLLQTLWAHTNGDPAPASNTMPAPDGTFQPHANAPYLGREAQLGVVCSDSPYPRNPASYPAQAAFAAARSGVVGPALAWGSEGCSQWPVLAPQRYTGPWNHPTPAPILVVGTTVDPVTPYRDAIAMSRDLANARLLTVHGYGDTALLNHSSCVDTVEDAYFVTGALPAPGTVCEQDQAPFAG